MKKGSKVAWFLLILLVGLAITFGIHAAILNALSKDPLENLIIESYIVNFALTAAIFTILLYLKETYASSLAYIFFMGSMAKAFVFGIFFRPTYMADELMEKAEFLSFFVPFAISLILEIAWLVRILNREKPA